MRLPTLMLLLMEVVCCGGQAFGQVHPLTGVYRVKFPPHSTASATLEILQLSTTKLKYLLSINRGAPSYNLGESEGIIDVHGDSAVDTIREFVNQSENPCVITLRFSFRQAVIDVENFDACGWGYGVYGGGKYVKVSGKPDFDNSNRHSDALKYKVIAAKAAFYSDSLLLKPKSAYVVQGEIIRDIGRGLDEPTKAVYTEIYDKAHLRLTYGWIPKEDLIELSE